MRAPQSTLPIRAAESLPFSVSAVRAAAAKVTSRGGGVGGGTASALWMPSQLCASASSSFRTRPEELTTLLPLTTAVDMVAAERDQKKRQEHYERRCETALRCGHGLVLIAVIAFICVVIVLFGIGLSRVNQAVNDLSGSALQSKLDRVLDHAMNAAHNTEQATLNALSVSQAATEAVQQVQPRVVEALNTSSAIMHELKAFSFNPRWTISAG